MKKIIIFTVGYVIFCISTLLHEWAHSLTAVIFGVKKNIFDIHYSYLPFLMGIDEKINYDLVRSLPNWKSILIAASGLIINGLLAILSLVAIKHCQRKISVLFWFAFAFFNISDWVNYLTFRTILLRGDTYHMVQFGFNYSILFIFGLISSTIFVYLLFNSALQQTNNTLYKNAADKDSFFYTIIIIFILMQLGALFNALIMY